MHACALHCASRTAAASLPLLRTLQISRHSHGRSGSNRRATLCSVAQQRLSALRSKRLSMIACCAAPLIFCCVTLQRSPARGHTNQSLLRFTPVPRVGTGFCSTSWRWLVRHAQGNEDDPPGELWLGVNGNGPAFIKRQTASLATFTAHVRRAASIAARDAPAIWFDNDHCPFCPWRAACDATARETRDIALLPGLSRRQGSALRQRGIHRLDQVVTLSTATLASLPDRVTATGARLQLQAQALLTGQPLPTGVPVPPLPRVGLFLDIESDPATREPWAFGLASASRDRLVIVVKPSPGNGAARIDGIPVVWVRNVQEGWRRVLDAVRTMSGMLAHWGEAERLMLEQSADPQTRQDLVPFMIDAQHELHRRVALPVPRLSDQRGGGLKAIARWLGWTWPPGADHWTLAWEAYRQWCVQPSPADAPDVLRPAIVYLAVDVEALAAVWRWLETFAASVNATGAPQGWRADRDIATNHEC